MHQWAPCGGHWEDGKQGRTLFTCFDFHTVCNGLDIMLVPTPTIALAVTILVIVQKKKTNKKKMHYKHHTVVCLHKASIRICKLFGHKVLVLNEQAVQRKTKGHHIPIPHLGDTRLVLVHCTLRQSIWRSVKNFKLSLKCNVSSRAGTSCFS